MNRLRIVPGATCLTQSQTYRLCTRYFSDRPHDSPNHHFRPQHSPTKPPDYRTWEFAKTTPSTTTANDRFKVISYNLLADYLVSEHRNKLYLHIPSPLLDWQWRKKNLIFELGMWSADIMCFQEVDKFHDLEKELKCSGYRGIWKMRTGEPIDGCAIFWRESRFKLIHEESIEFNKFDLRHNVAQICVLELMKPNNVSSVSPGTGSTDSNKIVVCNIHVFYNPKRGEIKLAQVKILLDKAHSISKGWNDAPVVLCGDFNCIPKSPLYNYISEQKLDLSGLGRDTVSGQASAEIHPHRRYNPGFRSFENMVPASSMVHRTEDVLQNESPLGMQKPDDSDSKLENVPLVENLSEAGSNDAILAYERSSTEVKDNEVEKLNERTGETQQSAVDNSSEVTSHYTKYDESNQSLKSDDGGFSGPSQANLPSSNSIEVEEKLDSSNSFNEVDEEMKGENIAEDSTTFLSALHSNDNSIPLRNVYNPSSWTPGELKIATGSAECFTLEHPLKLRSAYTEAQDTLGIRDSNGEPLATSYHSLFLGTVDYIWRSEGLQTFRVLAPIPKHVMQAHLGFPTKKWSSDHIALATEFVLVGHRKS